MREPGGSFGKELGGLLARDFPVLQRSVNVCRRSEPCEPSSQPQMSVFLIPIPGVSRAYFFFFDINFVKRISIRFIIIIALYYCTDHAIYYYIAYLFNWGTLLITQKMRRAFD